MTTARPSSLQKRSLILEAAGELFVKDGFDKVSMDQLAEAAGVSKQTVYSHFGSKEGLFQAAIDARCIAYDIRAIDPALPLRDWLALFADRFNRLLSSAEVLAMYRVCIASSQRDNKVARLFWESGPQQIYETVSGELKRRSELGELAISDDKLAIATDHLLTLLRPNHNMKQILGLESAGPCPDTERYIAASIELFLKYYQPNP